MRAYTVTWEIEIDATTPIDAARQALAVLREPQCAATMFKVRGEDGKERAIYIRTKEDAATVRTSKVARVTEVPTGEHGEDKP